LQELEYYIIYRDKKEWRTLTEEEFEREKRKVWSEGTYRRNGIYVYAASLLDGNLIVALNEEGAKFLRELGRHVYRHLYPLMKVKISEYTPLEKYIDLLKRALTPLKKFSDVVETFDSVLDSGITEALAECQRKIPNLKIRYLARIGLLCCVTLEFAHAYDMYRSLKRTIAECQNLCKTAFSYEITKPEAGKVFYLVGGVGVKIVTKEEFERMLSEERFTFDRSVEFKGMNARYIVGAEREYLVLPAGFVYLFR